MSSTTHEAPRGGVVHSANGSANGHAPAAGLRPADEFRQQLTRMDGELRMALPSHIKPEKFRRVVQTVVQQIPELLEADRRTLLGACMKCAADGLVPDNREAALVIFNMKIQVDGKDRWIKTVQYMPMMFGIMKRVRNSGEVASLQAHVIYEHDKFLIRRGITEALEHEPLFPGDRGKPIGAYAVAKFKDGSDPVFEVMDLAQIEKVRSVSRSKGGPTWTTWWDEMARKTVLRRLSKYLPMDAEVDSLLQRDDDAPRPVTIESADPVSLLPSKLDALSIGHDEDGVIIDRGGAGPGKEDGEDEQHGMET